MWRRIFYILFIVAMPYQAFAFGNCVLPPDQSCMDNEETYQGKGSYANCGKELETMSKDIKEYIECSKKELQQAADDLQKEADELAEKANAAIKKFNCKGQPEC